MMQGTQRPTEGTPAPCGRPLLYAAENLSLYHGHEGPREGAEHTHEDIQLGLPLSGAYHAAWQTAGGRRRQTRVPPGALLLNASRQPHTVETRQVVELAVVWLPTEFLTRTAEELAAPGSVEIVCAGTARDGLLQHLCLAMLMELRRDQAPARLYMDCIASMLAAHLVQQYSAARRTAREVRGNLSPRRLRLVLSYIGDNLAGNLALQDMADTAGLTVSHFARLFRQSTGQSPHQYVIGQRVERAKGLLRAGHMSLGEIAYVVGFGDQAHFTRHFKRLTGLTPSQFREHG